ncbi:molybdopterin cofactor-binding domain-containing protein [Ruegeria lacuscaerulensis]|uniref:molybdopterin cofactor-binding domain-containing protein n=1 Tax=Ruegeria lacuscaerulensis TaxID=55218 RepID=UPI003AF9EC0C
MHVSATTTEKVPNTIATAASSRTDVNAAAAINAARKIKVRLTEFLSEEHSVPRDQTCFCLTGSGSEIRIFHSTISPDRNL